MMYVTREMGESIDVGPDPMTMSVTGIGRGFVDVGMAVDGYDVVVERLKLGVTYHLPIRMGEGQPLAILKCQAISIQRGQVRFGLDAHSDVPIKPREKEQSDGQS